MNSPATAGFHPVEMRGQFSQATLKGFLVQVRLDAPGSEGCSLAFIEPEDEPQDPIAGEIKEAVTMGYTTALHDVKEAIDGNPAALEDVSSDYRKIAIRLEYLALFQKAMREEREEG